MKRRFAYIVKTSIEESTKGGEGQSQVQKLLEQFEKRVESIELESEGSTLRVDSVKMTSRPRGEAVFLPSGEKIFAENKGTPSLAGLRGKVRGRARQLLGG